MNRSFKSTALLLTMAFGACMKNGLPHGALSDEDLKAYAVSSFDKARFANTKVELGTHSGTPVIAEFPCSDVCPAYAVRVIHYVLPAGKQCADVHGELREFKVPIGIGVHFETFCFPLPIVAVWADYLRASS
jgi:hypothetical protein